MSVDRRNFLRLMGLSAAALPLLGHLPRAAAAAGAAPVRLILFPSMNGAQSFWPSGDLANMSVVTRPLAAFQPQIQFVRGIGIANSDNHFAVRSMFTGATIRDYIDPDPAVPSVDQVIAQHIAQTAPTPLRSLHLGAIPADAYEFYQLYGRSTFFFAPQPVDYEANPVTAYDRLFGAPAAPPPMPEPERDQTAAYHNAALSIAHDELAELRQRLGELPAQASKIDRHTAALAPLEEVPDGGGGGPPPPAAVRCNGQALASVEALRPALQGNPRAAYEHQHYSDIIDAQIDIIARAVGCGMTRVATLQCGSADGNVTVPIEGGLPHHNTSHADQAQFSRVQAWHASKFERLLSALDVPDPLCPAGNTVLYNSVVVWLSECMPSSHGSNEVPCMYAGNAGGRLVTGGLTRAGGNNLNLLRTLTEVFGVPAEATAHFAPTPIAELLS
jgi:hypothetical protein